MIEAKKTEAVDRTAITISVSGDAVVFTVASGSDPFLAGQVIGGILSTSRELVKSTVIRLER